MNQRAWPRASMVLLLALGAIAGGCRQRPPAAGKRPRVASLVPSVTDLIIGMGASDHLVAVSNYDGNRPEIRGLPRVGDYQNLDWEQLSSLRPDLMVIFIAPDRLPSALRQKADQLGMRLMNVRTERIEEILDTLTRLGVELDEKALAEAARQRLSGQLEAVRKRRWGNGEAGWREATTRSSHPPTLPSSHPAPVPTLVVSDANARSVVGRETFINDALEIAGGQNVIALPGWRTLEGEQLRSLRPEVIIQLLPDASEQVIEQAKRTWQSMPDLPAVRNHRVYILREWYVQQSGMHVGDLAERFAEVLVKDGSRVDSW
jgi:iron complex transport system substrate-binding protein